MSWRSLTWGNPDLANNEVSMALAQVCYVWRVLCRMVVVEVLYVGCTHHRILVPWRDSVVTEKKTEQLVRLLSVLCPRHNVTASPVCAGALQAVEQA